MVSLGMSIIVRTPCTIESLLSLIIITNNITCHNVVTTTKLYNHTILNKGSQVTDLPSTILEGLRYRGISIVNS